MTLFGEPGRLQSTAREAPFHGAVLLRPTYLSWLQTADAYELLLIIKYWLEAEAFCRGTSFLSQSNGLLTLNLNVFPRGK